MKEKQMLSHSGIKRSILECLIAEKPLLRFFAAFFVILLPLSMILGCSDQSSPSGSGSGSQNGSSSGEPVYYTPDPNDSKVKVLSVVVNTNTQTGEVFTELILQNTDDKECEVTFTLPEISAGIDSDTLVVTKKSGKENGSNNKSEDAENDTLITLAIGPEEYAGLTYTYKTKDNLSYKNTIGFDLTQLSKPFNDRIGHLEWTVDMSFAELFLVKEVFPVNFTVADNRVSVVLDQFLVSDLLDRVYLSGTTQTELLDLAEGTEASDEQNTLPVFFVNHYRKWMKDPSLVKVFSNPTLFKLWLYYDQGCAVNECEKIAEVVERYDDYIQFSEGEDLIFDYNGGYGYDEDTLKRYSTINSAFEYGNGSFLLIDEMYYELLYLIYHYDPDRFEIVKDDYEYLSWQIRMEGVLSSIQLERPALAAQIRAEKPTVYAVLMTELPKIEGYSWKLNQDVLMETYFKSVPADGTKAGLHKYRTVFLKDDDFSDPGVVREYLDALGVKAVVRLKIVSEGGEEDVALSEERAAQNLEYDSFGFFYDGTEDYPFENFRDDVSIIHGYAIPCTEPHKTEVSVPIFSMYWGSAWGGRSWDVDKIHASAYPNNIFLGGYVINATPASPGCATFLDSMLKRENPRRMIETRNERAEEAEKENKQLISKAREILDLKEGVKEPESFDLRERFGPEKSSDSSSEQEEKTIMPSLGTTGISNPIPAENDYDSWRGSYVYFGTTNTQSVKYRVLVNDTDEYSPADREGEKTRTMLLERDFCLRNHRFHNSVREENGGYWQKELDDGEQFSCDLREFLNGPEFLLDPKGFKDPERDAIALSTKTAPVYGDLPEYDRYVNSSGEPLFAPLSNDRVFLLDIDEVTRPAYGYYNGLDWATSRKTEDLNCRWLRSTARIDDFSGSILYDDGEKAFFKFDDFSPAFNLDLSSIIFSTPTSRSGKPVVPKEVSRDAGSDASDHSDSPKTYGSEYKLTLFDRNMVVEVRDVVIENEASGPKAQVTYVLSGSDAENATRMTVLVLDKEYTPGNSDAKILQYCSLNEEGELEGLDGSPVSVTFTLSDEITGVWGDDYHVYLLAEDVNGVTESDFASRPVEVKGAETSKEERSVPEN